VFSLIPARRRYAARGPAAAAGARRARAAPRLADSAGGPPWAERRGTACASSCAGATRRVYTLQTPPRCVVMPAGPCVRLQAHAILVAPRRVAAVPLRASSSPQEKKGEVVLAHWVLLGLAARKGRAG